MRIFGFDVFRTSPKRPKDIASQIIDLIYKLEGTPSGFRRRDVYLELRSLCLRNPSAVAGLVLGDGLSIELRERLCFQYSTDHGGSVRLSDNPRWARMMRDFIIPRMDELPTKFQLFIQWYQKTLGL